MLNKLGGKLMKVRVLNIGIFALSFVCLLIAAKLFCNLGIYADEFNTSPDVVLGGKIGLYMNWFMIGCVALICVLSGVNLFTRKN